MGWSRAVQLKAPDPMTAASHPPKLANSPGRGLEVGVAVAAALVVVASLALAVWVLREGSDDLQPASSALAGVPSVFSKRFVGLPLAAHDRDVLVGIGARPGGPLDIVVIRSDETVVSPEEIKIRLGTTSLPGTAGVSCGPRCLRFPLRVLRGAPEVLEVEVDRPGEPVARVTLHLPSRLPRGADALLRTARTRMLGLRSLNMEETLGAGLSAPVLSRWTFQAPDRMRYTVAGGGRGVVIGSRRWDWVDGRWERSSIPSLRFPTFVWAPARGARLVGRATVDRQRVRVLAVRKPGVDFPMWFRLYVTDDGRVLRSEMLTTGHFMVDRYANFNSAPSIRPPT